MSGIIIRQPPAKDAKFQLVYAYDATKVTLPISYTGFRIFINNDQSPLVELVVDQPKIWSGTIDLAELYGEGTYELRVESSIWEHSAFKSSSIIVLEIGDQNAVHVCLPPIDPPPFPFPTLENPTLKDAYESSIKEKLEQNKSMRTCVDNWSVYYPG